MLAGWCGGSDSGEGAVDVADGEDAVDAAVGFEEEVFGGGGAAEGFDEGFAAEVGGEGEVGFEAAGEVADGDPGAAVFGGLGDGFLADEAAGCAVVVDDDECAGVVGVGAADGFGEGGVGGDEGGAAGEAAGGQQGDAVATCSALWLGWRRPR
ncbi:hypothetical protein BJF79_21070 [Actinomadura sp. CNU-125]|nr:hypothetical protein BJF79_21070 [Actinomadura sp. CNU-125]